jgi:hypothetical protein
VPLFVIFLGVFWFISGSGLMELWSVGVRGFPAEFTADHGRGLGGVGRVKIESLVPSRIFLPAGPLAREVPCSACRV